MKTTEQTNTPSTQHTTLVSTSQTKQQTLKSRKQSVLPNETLAIAIALISVTVLDCAPPTDYDGTETPEVLYSESSISSELEVDSRFVQFGNIFQKIVEDQSSSLLDVTKEEQQRALKWGKNRQQQCEKKGCSDIESSFNTRNMKVNLQPINELKSVMEDLLEAGYSTKQIASSVIRISGLEYQFHETDYETNDDVLACQEDCQRTYLISAATALTTYVSALAACTLTGPGWPFCVAAATWAYGVAVNNAGKAAEACVDDCEQTYGEGGSEEDDGYCEDDSDCDSDEYCDTGVVLGIGQNQCKSLKSEGAACSRDGQCESGCCNFYWYWWQCRPSNKC